MFKSEFMRNRRVAWARVLIAFVAVFSLGLTIVNFAMMSNDLEKAEQENKQLKVTVTEQEEEIKALKDELQEANSLISLIENEFRSLEEKIQNISTQQVSRGTTRTKTFQATAYSSIGDTGSFTTATGTHVSTRTIAVDPNVIPLGSQVRITFPNHPERNGVYVAEDTGGVVKGNIIDIWMESVDECYSFGRQQVQVEIL